MSTWYERGVFYHMYPLGMTGAPKHNDPAKAAGRFKELFQWIPHIKSLGCNAIYIGPLFEPPAMDTIPGIINWWTGVWAITVLSENLWTNATRRA